MDETIFSSSPIGKRLEAIKKGENYCLLFQGKKIPLVARISIGRNRDNSIVIDNQLVSRYHADLQKIESAFYVRDLYSRNGTFINGKKLTPNKFYKLTVNDTIKIANAELTILS